MLTTLLVVAIYTSVLLDAFAGEESKLSAESLRTRFSEVRELLNKQAVLKSVSSEKIMRTEFDTPTRRGVDLKSDDLDLTLDPVTGRILFITTKTETKQGNGPGMNEREVQLIAETLVEKLGTKVDSGMKFLHRSFDRATGRWNVTWEKQIDGYPFPEEAIWIAFNDRDRSIALFGDSTTDLKCQTKPVIEEKKARTSAEVRIKDLLPELLGEHYEIASVTQGKLQVAYPNGRYVRHDRSEGKGASETGPQPRLVYSFDLTFKYTGAAALRKATPPIEIWVDALIGNVVGGL